MKRFIPGANKQSYQSVLKSVHKIKVQTQRSVSDECGFGTMKHQPSDVTHLKIIIYNFVTENKSTHYSSIFAERPNTIATCERSERWRFIQDPIFHQSFALYKIFFWQNQNQIGNSKALLLRALRRALQN